MDSRTGWNWHETCIKGTGVYYDLHKASAMSLHQKSRFIIIIIILTTMQSEAGRCPKGSINPREEYVLRQVVAQYQPTG